MQYPLHPRRIQERIHQADNFHFRFAYRRMDRFRTRRPGGYYAQEYADPEMFDDENEFEYDEVEDDRE